MKKSGGFVKRSKTTKIIKPAERAGHLFLQPLLPNDADTKCYLVGGYCDQGPLCDVWSFHVNSSTWKLLSNEEVSQQSPLPRSEFDGCVTSSGIYIFGGFQSDGQEVAITNDLWLFDLEYEAWQLVSEESKPPERSGHVMVNIDNDKFIVHGGTCMGARGDLWVYETSLRDWWEVPCELDKSPCPRWMHTAAFCRDSQLLVIFGGLTQPQSSSDSVVSEQPSPSSSPEYLNDLWILNMNGWKSNSWSCQWQMVQYHGLAPSPRDLPAIAAMNGSIIIMGGFGLLEVDELDNEEEEEAEEELDEEGEENAKCAGMDLEINNQNTHQLEESMRQGQGSEENMIVSVDDVSLSVGENDQTEEAVVVMNQAGQGPETNDDNEDDDDDDEDDDDEDDEVDEDDEIESIDIAYLDDTWYVNLQTSETAGKPFVTIYSTPTNFYPHPTNFYPLVITMFP